MQCEQFGFSLAPAVSSQLARTGLIVSRRVGCISLLWTPNHILCVAAHGRAGRKWHPTAATDWRRPCHVRLRFALCNSMAPMPTRTAQEMEELQLLVHSAGRQAECAFGFLCRPQQASAMLLLCVLT